MGTELENLCSLLCIFILHVSILTHASPSPPLLTFGARHSHGCGRLYACSPPGGTQCPPFAVHVTVINTTTTTTHMAKYGKNRSTRRSTPRHPIAMASTAKPPDPMPCALAAILLPESSAPACHMRKTLFPGTFWVHAGCGCVRAVPACGVRRCGVGARRESR